MDAAARSVLADWRDGRIGGWVEPPNDQESEEDAVQRKTVVASWGKEFVIEGLWGDEFGEGDKDPDEGVEMEG